MKSLTIPISDEEIHNLKVGESVLLSGVIVTGRDAVHKWLIDTFINNTIPPTSDDFKTIEQIKPYLAGGVIYHCGPIIKQDNAGKYTFVAAGPTTSIREEPYQGDVMRKYNVKGVIGKGGMGEKTLKACNEVPGVYFHAVGGAASLIAQSVKEVLGVYKLDFGVPEAIWVIDVVDFPVVVTMDANLNSLHEEIDSASKRKLDSLLSK